MDICLTFLYRGLWRTQSCPERRPDTTETFGTTPSEQRSSWCLLPAPPAALVTVDADFIPQLRCPTPPPPRRPGRLFLPSQERSQLRLPLPAEPPEETRTTSGRLEWLRRSHLCLGMSQVRYTAALDSFGSSRCPYQKKLTYKMM